MVGWSVESIILPRCLECRRGLAMRILAVCLSICSSVRQTRGLWQNERKVSPDFIPCERSFSLVFWEEEWLVGATPSIWNFGPTGPRWNEIADFEPIIAHSASAVRPSEKSSININRKSPMRFPTYLRWSSYVAPSPPKGAQKRLKKVCYKVSLCVKTVSDIVVRHSLT